MGLFDAATWRTPLRDRSIALDLVPPSFMPVAEALEIGRDATDACLVVGAQLAESGTSLEEALQQLRATSQTVIGQDPAFTHVEALCLAWSESTLGYLHQISCEDPMTGLASLAHLRSRLSELYRAERRAGAVPDNYALVILEVPTYAGGGADHISRALVMAQLGQAARTVFVGGEATGRVGLRRIAVLATRDSALSRRVALLRTLTEAGDLRAGARVWIEGLPPTDVGAGNLLDELAR